MYMIVIVGGGISGLYLGHLLRALGKEFVILEREARVGGRLDDRRWHRRLVAAGAGIFHSNQKHMMYLVERFGVERWSTAGRTTFYDFSPALSTSEAVDAGAGRQHRLPPLAPVRGDRRVRDTVPAAYRLYDPSFDEYADMNYNDWLASKRGVGEIYSAKLSTLVQALRDELREYIRTGCNVEEIRPNCAVVRRNGRVVELPFDACVLTCSRKESEAIRFEDVQLRARVRLARALTKTCSSLRVYTYSRRGHGLSPGYIVSNKPFRFAIRIDDHVLMASYTDERRARALMRGESAERIAARLAPRLAEQLGIEVDDAVAFPWEDAYTITHYAADRRLLNGIHKLSGSVYQTFVPNRRDQAWAESHLLQVAKVARALSA